jgi:hypothetical protein
MIELYTILKDLILSQLTVLNDVFYFLLRKLKEYIFWLQISMNNSTLSMEKIKSYQCLLGDPLA